MRCTLLFAALLSLGATAATAEPKHSLLMARVTVGDLDLRSASGAERMMRRLDAAATELCALPQSAVLPGNPGREWRCRRDAVASAVQRLRTPQLESAHLAWLSAIRP